MSVKSFVYENSYVRKINGLYLDSRTSDVKFVFDIDTDHPEKVPAHKNILSLDNPVFDTMFYGSIKEEGDIPIADASAAAFKEFLQFFYLEEVRLTPDNIVQVINLCKKYEMYECMKACESTLQNSLTIDDMCLGYSIALLLEQKDLIEFCEEKIKTNARDIMKSESFLDGGRSLLENILTLVSSHWSALETVVACMEWAKAECNRNNLDTTPENLRTQFGELFTQIPFEKLTLEQFTQHVVTYTGFFNVEEIGIINQNILLQCQQSNSFDIGLLAASLSTITPSPINILDCDRWENGVRFHKSKTSITKFVSNKKLLLTKFYVPDINGKQMQFSIYRGGFYNVFKACANLTALTVKNQCIELTEPFVIEAEKSYGIVIMDIENKGINIPNFKNVVQLAEDIEIKFKNLPNDLVLRLIFQLPEN